jgi:hypothetical protein
LEICHADADPVLASVVDVVVEEEVPELPDDAQAVVQLRPMVFNAVPGD